MTTTLQKCETCDGCGKVANTDDQEPWTDWLALPLQSQGAMVLGLVKPIPCPDCDGDGCTACNLVPGQTP